MSPFGSQDPVLPKRAPRARARFDRVNFREPGDMSAQERKKHLENEITRLREEEAHIKQRLDETRNKSLSRAEVEGLGNSLFHINIKKKGMKPETQLLCQRVEAQVDETKKALAQALAPRVVADVSKELMRKKKEYSRHQRDLKVSTLRVEVLDSEIKELEEVVRDLQEGIRDIQEALEIQEAAWGVERDTDFQGRDFKLLFGEQMDDTGTPTGAVAAGRPNEKDGETQHDLQWEFPRHMSVNKSSGTVGNKVLRQDEDTRETQSVTATLGTHATQNDRARTPRSARTGTSQVLDGKDMSGKGYTTYDTRTEVFQRKWMGEKAVSRSAGYINLPEQPDPGAGTTDANLKTSHTPGIVPELKEVEGETETEKIPEVKAKIRAMSGNMPRLRHQDSLKSEGYQESFQTETDITEDLQENLSAKIKELSANQTELSSKKTEREDVGRTREGLRQKVAMLEKEIEDMIRKENDKGWREADNESDRQWQKIKREDQKREINDLERQKQREKALEEVRKDFAKSNRLRDAKRRRQRDLSVNSGDESYSDADGQEEINESNHIEALRKIIGQVEALEENIRIFRKLNEKMDRVVDLRIVLERELDLERQWLATRVKQATASATTEDSSTTESRDHFSSSMPSDFNVYKPLEPDQIRLLVLWPAKADYHPLLCTLQTATWGPGASNPRYAALSYNWGTDLCNGRLYLVLQDGQVGSTDPNTWGSTARYALRIPIRNNLFRALLRLRRPDRPVSLWVDSLCINQNNLVEKTQQLEQMVKVYRDAENVCVWLGESDNEGRSDEAMDFITAIMDFAVLDRYAKDSKQAKKWRGLAELMRDRWFSRRWVVQEISLAREATVHCGSKMVQWADFADAVSLLASNQEAIRKLFDYKEWRDGPNTLGDIQSFGAYILLEATSRLFLRTAQGEITRPVKRLESLVTSLKTFDASDKKDLIYSLVSIAADTPQGLNIYSGKRAVAAKLEVDYAKSPIKVYKDFTKFCILSSKSLDILCRPWAMPVKTKTETEDKSTDLPSWIPLLSQSEFGNPEEVYSGRKNGENLVGPVDRPHYKASGDNKYDVELANEQLEDLDFLPVTGFKLARIENVSPRNTGGVILRESLKMGGWNGISEDTAGVPDRIWRTLVADRDPDGQIPPTWYQRACLRCLEIADTFNNGDLNIGELLQDNSELIRKYLTRVRNVTWNRRFFQADMGAKLSGAKAQETSKGVTGGVTNGYNGKETKVQQKVTNRLGFNIQQIDLETEGLPLFGLGPPEMGEGDFVCILTGCTVPIILREQNGYMKFIGEAYVHGKMEGEAVEDLEEGKTWGESVGFKLK